MSLAGGMIKLFHVYVQDKHYDPSLDTGDQAIQCGRCPEAFHLWLMLKSRGQAYVAELIENAIKSLKYFHRACKNFQPLQRPYQTKLVVEGEELDISKNMNVCFFIYPKCVTYEFSLNYAFRKSCFITSNLQYLISDPGRKEYVVSWTRLRFAPKEIWPSVAR